MIDERTGSMKWKSHLLSSSLPLEYEVAKLLVAEKIYVRADYSYTRKFEGHEKEFSVDISAHGTIPFGVGDQLDAHLHLLVECKHSLPNKKWLFLVEPNEPDFNPIYFSTFRVFDQFSSYSLPRKNLVHLDDALTGVYKGVEVNLSDGDVSDVVIKSGINQLRYALPELIASELWFRSVGHPVDNTPVIVVPVLVTTAEIYVAKEEFTMAKVRTANTLDDLAEKVDFALVYSAGGPDFERHLRDSFVRMTKQYGLDDEDPLLAARNEVLKSKNQAWRNASYADAFSSQHYTHFVVCNFDALPQFLRALKGAAEADVSARTAVFSVDQLEAIKATQLKRRFSPK